MEEGVIFNKSFRFKWLFSLPCFPIRAEQITVLHKPDEFYRQLITCCSFAKKRIVLASLYIGSGEQELHLVQTLKECLTKRSTLNVKILLDGFRGCRGKNSSKEILSPLVKQFPHCQVALYYTPKFPRLFRKIMPERYNEIYGLQHMKVYIFDDNVIISGANLSQDYFTNRQDRYILVNDCKPLADFFDGVVGNVCNMSSRLTENNCVTQNYSFKTKSEYMFEFRNKISNYYDNYCKKYSSPFTNTEYDTWIIPLIELPTIGINYDSSATKRIFQEADNGSLFHLATGYFNLTDEYRNIIIKSSKATYKLLLAHPTANGFHNASGFSSYIPAIYTVLAERFLNEVLQSSSGNRISMYEYRRNNWTYHGKGLWYTPPGESLPQMTIVGSTNFGDRSTQRDLENQITIITNNISLKKELDNEGRNLFKHGELLSPETVQTTDRKSPFWLYYFVSIFRSFF